MSSRKRNASYNLISNLAMQVIVILSGFITPRLILMEFGSTVNGMVGSVSQFLTYAGLVELGVGNAAIVALYRPLADGNRDETNGILSRARKQYNLSGILYTLIVMGIACVYPFLVRDQLDMSFVFTMVCIIGLKSTIDYFLIGKYKVLLVANQKYYIIYTVQAIFTIILTIGSVLLLVNHGSLVLVKGLAVLTHLGEAGCIALYVKRKYRYVDYHAELSPKFSQQSGAIIHQICSAVTYNTDLVVLTLLLPANSMAEVSVYGVYNLVSTVIKRAAGTITNSVYDGFGEMYAKGKQDSILSTYHTYEFLYFGLLFLLYSCDLMLVLPFIAVYTRGIDDASYVRMGIAVLFVVKDLMSQTKDSPAIMIRASGSFKQTQHIYIIESTVNIALSLALVRKMGIAGVLIGTVAGHVISNIMVEWYCSRHFLPGTAKMTIRRLVRNTALMCLLFLAERRFIVMSESWALWVLQAVVIFLVHTVVYVLVNMLFERKLSMQLIRQGLATVKHKRRG